jgi:hypothetical protein
MANTNFVVRNGLVVSNVITANTSGITLNLAGNTGSVGQVLASNGSGGLYWTDALTATGNTTFSGNVIFSGTVYANGSAGDAGQVLTTNGSGTYWSTGGGGGGTSINLSANTTDTSTYYFPMSNSSSGTWSNGVIANTSIYFVPATGTLSATIFNSLSDLEYKTDVSKINNAVDVLKQLDGVSFKWKETGHKSYGVIAQEVEKVLPEIVDINNDVKSVNYQALIGFLIEAVKELSDKVEKLENAK